MSEVTIESLQEQLNASNAQLTTLKDELANSQNVIKFFQAQMEAQKGMLNDQLASNIQLRTNLHMVNLDNKAKDDQIKLLTNKIE